MNTVRLTSLILLLSCAFARADEKVRRVQEELRKRNLYFADIDGQLTKETENAVRRYQKRKGFAANGAIDADTLRSLDLAPPGPPPPEPVAEEILPDMPVLKSDAARELAEADKKILDELESNGPLAPIGEAPPSLDQPSESPDEPASRAEPASPVAARAENFVRSYLEACETNQLSSELAFYADRVSYFDHGEVGRDFIAKDVARYYKRWPQRNYELLDFKLGPGGENEVEVKFRIGFQVKSPSHRASGKTVNVFKIRQTGDDLRFVSLKEQRIRK